MIAEDDSNKNGTTDLSPRAQVSHPRRAKQVDKAGRKLDQFPSPQPLTEQERLLARYVQDYPQEAVILAREQAEFEKEIEQWKRDLSLEIHSDRQER